MNFKKDFVWGVATSSYQIEGTHGKFENIWDDFCSQKDKVKDNQNGLIACNHINLFKDDINLMANLGIKAYRFSISWPRIMPNGEGEVSTEGLQFYHALIDELLLHNIEPFITLYHWDLPLALQKQGGWQNPKMVKWFSSYAALISKEFSSKVKYFITINEPQCFLGLGYVSGEHAPGLKLNFSDGLFLVHNTLKAHGAAVRAIRENAKQEVQIGFAPTGTVSIPMDNTNRGIESARKSYFEIKDEDQYFWSVSLYSDPIILGDYPKEYYEKYKGFIPNITKDDLKLINEKIDFLGQNIYMGNRVNYDGKEIEDKDRALTDMNWYVTESSLYWGPKFLYERYKLPIYITENGMANKDFISEDGKIHDKNRIDFLNSYLHQLGKAIEEGNDVKGYFLWSFMDNFEWTYGYNKRFGIVYTDYKNLSRYIKDSGYWYKKTIEENGKNL